MKNKIKTAKFLDISASCWPIVPWNFLNNGFQRLKKYLSSYVILRILRSDLCTEEVHVLCWIPMYVCVVDFNIRKTLAFRAHYVIKCSLISDPVTRSTLQSLANFSYEEIKVVCQNGMFVIECVNIGIIISCNWYSRSYSDMQVSKILVGWFWNDILTYSKFSMIIKR